jgi:hypothetical protein
MFILLCVPFFAQVESINQQLIFSPQGSISGTKKVEMWAVSGCLDKALPISTIYAIATKHKIRWMTPKTAIEIVAKKSLWSRIVRILGYSSVAAGALMTMKVIEARPSIATGFVAFGTLTTILMPMAQKEVPITDPSTGQSLMLNVDGCGETSIYAFPSKIEEFIEVISK